MEWTEVMLRLVLAAIFGAAIGLERERKSWVAGMRTHMMVCLGSALAMLVSAYGFNDVLGKPHIELDPSRVAAQVVSGIGFIGAGTILFLKQGVVRGLTTAAGLWTVAAIGLATGGGMYFAAILTTVLALTILWVMQPLEKRFAARFKKKTLRITTVTEDLSIQIINGAFSQDALNIATCSVDKTHKEFIVTISFKNIQSQALANLINKVQKEQGVKEVMWIN